MTPSTGITFNWYSVSGGGASLGTGNSYTTAILSTTTSIWAEGTNTCAASPRVQYSINIIPSPTVSLGVSAANISNSRHNMFPQRLPFVVHKAY